MLVADEPQVRLDFVIDRGLRVLEVVKDVDLSVWGLGRDDLLVLRHIPRSVDLALVVDLDVDRNSGLLIIGDARATNSVGVVVQDVLLVVAGVFRGFQWDFDLEFKFQNER